MLNNFGYVIDNEIAGLAHPDTFGDIPDALADLRSRGITALVSADEYGLPPAPLQAAGLSYLHIPIPDFHAPQLPQALQFIQFVQQQRAQDQSVAVHCRGGYGRTGTLIASYLISTGATAQEAIQLVRQRRPGSIETRSQEQFLHELEQHLKG